MFGFLHNFLLRWIKRVVAYGVMKRMQEALLFIFLAVFSETINGARPYSGESEPPLDNASYCLSWRVAVEANNVRGWHTVPTQCMRYVETYMTGGQYEQDLKLVIDQIVSYMDSIDLSKDGMDAWILDVDDTCITNLMYYRGKRFGYVANKTFSFRKFCIGCGRVKNFLLRGQTKKFASKHATSEQSLE